MVCLDDEALADRCLLLRRWGRRSEVQLYGSRKGQGDRFFSELDGLEYDNLFIFDELGWNFEPSELSAAFGVVQLKKLPAFLARRKRNFALLRERLAAHPDCFVLPRTTPGIDTAWHMFPVLLRLESGIRRAHLQQYLEGAGVDTRMVWTGNAVRQPAFRNIAMRIDRAGLANADRVMEQGLILPMNHALGDEHMHYIGDRVDAYLREERGRSSRS
jgi:CDP-6-deoxy-D-xylo-4-hexulose-3-dehydrase